MSCLMFDDEAVAGLTEGWSAKQTFTPSSYTSWSAYGGCYYRKRGTTVELNVALENVSAQLNVSITTLPSGFRPLHPVGASAVVAEWNTVNAGILAVDEQGVVRMSSQVGSAYFIGHMYFETV